MGRHSGRSRRDPGSSPRTAASSTLKSESGTRRFSCRRHNPDFGTSEPRALGGTPVRLALDVEDADATVAAAERAGARVLIPVDDQFYGYRAGRIEDPFGHVWIVSQLIESLSQEEMQRRMDEMFGG